MRKFFVNLKDDIALWGRGWSNYITKKLHRFGARFETNKSFLVDILMARRGGYQKPFLHFSLAVIVVAGAISAPSLANAYPAGLPGSLQEFTPPSAVVTSLDLTEYGVQTQVSEKPRDQVITYVVEKGDTLAKISEKFGVAVESIKWVNDTKRDSLTIGQEIKIPPVTGVVHKVKEGETVYSIAKKYKTDPQKIVNFPFNDFSDLDTFALNVGQTLIVPDGVMPEAAPIRYAIPPSIIAGGTGQYIWPVGGAITQYPVWYHMAVDIANPSAPGIAAADTGIVTLADYMRYGYGNHIVIDHGNGYQTLYAHLSEIYIKAGDRVARGQTIGRMGSTGRSTGMHLHFEVRVNGIAINPLSFLK